MNNKRILIFVIPFIFCLFVFTKNISVNAEDEFDNELKATVKNSEDYYYSDYEARYDIKPDESKKLEVAVSAIDDSQLSYTWYIYKEDEDEIIEKENTSSLIVSGTDGSKDYKCVVSDQYDNIDTVYFYVRIDNQLDVHLEGYTGNMYGIGVAYGGDLELQMYVSAYDESKLKYYWKYVNEEDEEDESIHEKIYSKTLKLTNVTDKAVYKFCVNDGYGGYVEKWLYLHIDNHLKAYVSGTDKNKIEYNLKPAEEKVLSIDVTADDTEGLKYQWYEDKYFHNGEDEPAKKIEGANGTSYKISNLTDKKQYYCDVTDKFNNTVSVTFLIRLNHLNAYSEYLVDEDKYLQESDIEVEKGSDIELEVFVTADDLSSVTYSWAESGKGFIEGENNKTLKLTDIKEDKGYYVHVGDGYGNDIFVMFNIKIKGSSPTSEPTASPTTEPSKAPTATPVKTPSAKPTAEPTKAPSATPAKTPSAKPTSEPTMAPTAVPAKTPTVAPSPKTTKIDPTLPKAKSVKAKYKKNSKMVVSWKKLKSKQLKKIKGFEIQYSTDKLFNNSVVTKSVNKKKKSYTIKKLKKKTTYYVRIRTYKTSSGEKVYSNWSSVKKVKIKK